jgi:hypothetical protein
LLKELEPNRKQKTVNRKLEGYTIFYVKKTNTKRRKLETSNILFRVFKISCFRDKNSFFSLSDKSGCSTIWLIDWIVLPILQVLFWNIQDLPVGYCFYQNASIRHWVNGSILVVDRASGRIAELADSRHNVYGVGIYDKPQWLSDVDFYFWYKGCISSDSLWCHLFYGLLFTSLFRKHTVRFIHHKYKIK